MVLQRLEGLSDREAVDRFCFDARWKYAAGGLDFGYPGFVHTVLVDMRARLARSEAPGRVFEWCCRPRTRRGWWVGGDLGTLDGTRYGGTTGGSRDCRQPLSKNRYSIVTASSGPLLLGRYPEEMKRLACAAIGTAVLLAIPAVPARADFGSTPCGGTPRNCVNLADNKTHTWYPEGVLGNQIPGIASAFQTGMNDYENFTKITTTKTQSSTLDVLVTDYPYPQYYNSSDGGVLGWVECLPNSNTSGSQPNRRCDRQKLRLNSTSYPDYYSDFGESHSLSNHEIGHTLGLRHTTSVSCMRTPFSKSLYYTYTNTSEEGQIDAHY